MACPYFMPIEKLENGNWPHPGRLPLGCGWSGHCTAPGHEEAVPSHDVLVTFCNLGYGSGCGWAPAERPSDAVRFAVVAPKKGPGEGQNGESPARTLHVTYVYERDHRPAGHGELEFDLSTSEWLRRHPNACIQKMAESFLESYLQKKS